MPIPTKKFLIKSLNREQCQRKLTYPLHQDNFHCQTNLFIGGRGDEIKKLFKVLKTYLNMPTPAFFFQYLEIHKIKFQQTLCPLLLNFISYLLTGMKLMAYFN